jgi:hypothetical protein
MNDHSNCPRAVPMPYHWRNKQFYWLLYWYKPLKSYAARSPRVSPNHGCLFWYRYSNAQGVTSGMIASPYGFVSGSIVLCESINGRYWSWVFRHTDYISASTSTRVSFLAAPVVLAGRIRGGGGPEFRAIQEQQQQREHCRVCPSPTTAAACKAPAVRFVMDDSWDDFGTPANSKGKQPSLARIMKMMTLHCPSFLITQDELDRVLLLYWYDCCSSLNGNSW